MEDEFIGADLGDRRRAERLSKLAGDLWQNPAASFPQAAPDDASLEATYRFLGNESVLPEKILEPHFRRSVERLAEQDLALVLHDTTEFEFPGEAKRRGLGRLRNKGQGFFGHVSLGVTADEVRRPLGVLEVKTLFRTKKPMGRRGARAASRDPNNEGRRWYGAVHAVHERVGGQAKIVHVMDREADSYELFSRLHEGGHRFVIRAAHDRRLSEFLNDTGVSHRLSDALSAAPVKLTRTVPLSKRRRDKALSARRIFPQRPHRVANLRISSTALEIRRPDHLSKKEFPESVSLNVIQVREQDTNGEYPPVQWVLLTTEPIKTEEEIARVVDFYRARWVIEEYFKALKTGCAYQKRQLESAHSLLNALAVFIPIAWRLLLLRTLAREDNASPASEALPRSQVDVLVATSKGKLSPEPTAREALLAVAALGGHIKNNGEPGWLVLARGYEKLLTLEMGWLAAQRKEM